VASTRQTTCTSSYSTSSGLNHSNMNGNSLATSSSESLSSLSKYASKISIWDDSFSFDNLPLDVKEIKLLLFCKAKQTNFSASFVNNLKKISNTTSGAKMQEPLLIGAVHIRLEDLINKGLCENWYTVEPVVQIPTYTDHHSTGESANGRLINQNCTMRVKIRYCEERIQLNRSYYKQLCAYLLDESEHKHLCTIYEQIVPSTERPHLVQALLRFFIVKNQIVEMLKSFLLTEIDRCGDLGTLFRPATMSTSLMDHYMRTRCNSFLRRALEDALVKILKQNSGGGGLTPTSSNSMSLTGSQVKSFELDPAKCPDPVQREQNLLNFQEALKELINSICGQVNLFPNELKYLFHLVRRHVFSRLHTQRKAGFSTADDKLVRIYCVSAFVFLRLLCPAMLNPKSFGLKFYENHATPNLESHLLSERRAGSCSNQLDYNELAVQFSVFSPSFMFSLTASNASSLIGSSNEHTLTSNSSAMITCFNLTSNSTGSSTQAQVSTQLAAVYERHIKLLAKVLQTLANMTECKEPFMLPLSEFLNTYKPNVIKFIEEISNLTELNEAHVIKINDFYEDTDDFKKENSNCPPDELDADGEVHMQFENASCKYLAILNRLLNSFVPQMKDYLTKSDSKEPVLNMDDDIDCERSNKEDDTSFKASLKRLINILNEINNKHA